MELDGGTVNHPLRATVAAVAVYQVHNETSSTIGCSRCDVPVLGARGSLGRQWAPLRARVGPQALHEGARAAEADGEARVRRGLVGARLSKEDGNGEGVRLVSIKPTKSIFERTDAAPKKPKLS